jgi:hypothetical protein
MNKNVFPKKEIEAQINFLSNNPQLVKEFDLDVKENFTPTKLKKYIKTAKEWAEEYLNSEECKLELEKLNKEAIDYMLYGKPTSCLNEEFLDELKDYCDIEKCLCCNGTGTVEGEYVEDIESCLTCNGRGFL